MLVNPVTGKVSLVQEIDSAIIGRLTITSEVLEETLRKLVLSECINKPSIAIEVTNKIIEAEIVRWAKQNQITAAVHPWSTGSGGIKRQVEVIWWYQQGPREPNYRACPDGSFLLLNKS
jgi:hypothetical protein